MAISAAEPTSGCCPPMLPPACSVMMLTPFSMTRWSTALLPCAVRLRPTSAMAAPPTSLPPPDVPAAMRASVKYCRELGRFWTAS